MATPIAETPILSGQDLVDFIIDMETCKKVSAEELAEAHKAYEWVKSHFVRN